MSKTTFLTNGFVRPAILVGEEDGHGHVELFAPEADGNQVKSFVAKKAAADSGADYEEA